LNEILILDGVDASHRFSGFAFRFFLRTQQKADGNKKKEPITMMLDFIRKVDVTTISP